MRKLLHIFAQDENNAIGVKSKNGLPWHCKEDMEFFKKVTTGNIVIMGRKTFESLGCKPLPNRVNIVISSKNVYPDVHCYKTIVEALEFANKVNIELYNDKRTTSSEVIFIIGGKELYSQTTTIVDGVIMSTIRHNNVWKEEDVITADWTYPPVVDSYELDFGVIKDAETSLLNVSYFHVTTRAMDETLFPYEYAVGKSVTEDYESLLDTLLFKYEYDKKRIRGDRTGAGTVSIFGRQLTFNVTEHAPFVTHRKLPLRSTLGELMWFINGDNNVKTLKEKFKCNFWDEWKSDVTDTIGPMYGYKWRRASDGTDPLKGLVEDMVFNPTSRRMVISAWDAGELPPNTTEPKTNPENNRMALAPCHFAFQVYIDIDPETNVRNVSLMWNQRSADVLMGLPVNIASYYFLLCILCKAAEEKANGAYLFKPYELKCSLGDAHLYSNHIKQAYELQKRHTLPPAKFTVPDGAFDLILDRDTEYASRYQQRCFDSVENYRAHENVKLARNV